MHSMKRETTIQTDTIHHVVIHVPHRTAVTIGGNNVHLVWGDCLRCSQLTSCPEPFPSAGRCLGPSNNILLAAFHKPIRTLPKRGVTKELLNRHPLLASLWLKVRFDRHIPIDDFRQLHRLYVDDAAIATRDALLQLILDLCGEMLRPLCLDFIHYYELETESVTSAIGVAVEDVLLNLDDAIIDDCERQGIPWQVVFHDCIKFQLFDRLDLGFVDCSGMSAGEFRRFVESEWKRLMPYQNWFFGFHVVPVLCGQALIEYLELPNINKATANSIIAYLAYGLKEHPWVCRGTHAAQLDRGFRVVMRCVFRRLVRSACRKVATILGLQGHERRERRDIENDAWQVFDKACDEFTFFWKTFDHRHALGPHGAVRAMASDVERNNLIYGLIMAGLAPSDAEFAVLPFPRYIERRMAAWVRTFLPDAVPRIEASLDAPFAEDDHRAYADLVRSDRVTPDLLNLRADFEDACGTQYWTIRHVSEITGLSCHQIRRIDTPDNCPSVRVRDVLTRPFPPGIRPDTRMFPANEETLERAKLHATRRATHTSRLSGTEIPRKTAAKLLGIPVSTLRVWERTGRVIPVKTGRSIAYGPIALDAARAIVSSRKRCISEN
jgi:hypothetical protein